MSSTKKANNYHFGLKVHTGVDIGSNIVHSLEVTTAKVNDSEVFADLLHVTADRAYDTQENVRHLRRNGARCGIIKKKKPKKNLRESLVKRNKKNARLRGFAEFAYNVVKNHWGQSKARFKGLEKNKSWYYLCFAMSNIYMVRKKLA